MIHSTLLMLATLIAGGDPSAPTVMVIVGAEGTPEYGEIFGKVAGEWKALASKAGAEYQAVRPEDAGQEQRDRFRQALSEEPKKSPEPLWLVLVGHGTFDRKTAKFNVDGPDFSSSELAEWLQPFERPVVVLCCFSSSAPFLKDLSGPGRVVVSATKSGHEHNYSRFGEHFVQALADPQADLDQDEQVSLLEGFLTASRRVQAFYKNEGRLATEHALLDDNGDGFGTPIDFFRGLRATQKPKGDALADGTRAHQLHLVPSDFERKIPPPLRAERNRLELAIAALREEKPILPADAYYQRLEKLLVELARLYEKIEAAVERERRDGKDS